MKEQNEGRKVKKLTDKGVSEAIVPNSNWIEKLS